MAFCEATANANEVAMTLSPEEVLGLDHVMECVERGLIVIDKLRMTYNLNQKRTYNWQDPEEWVRCHTIAFLIIEKGYPANRIRTEVTVPRRTPSDSADIVVYFDDRCREPYLVVENKADPQTAAARKQGIEQLFGNANSLRSPLGLYDEYGMSTFYDVASHPPTERQANIRGGLEAIPPQYGEASDYAYVVGGATDISPARASVLENRVKRAHSLIWSGGKRDPLTAFDEWSKLLFAKVIDERYTKSGEPRRFQVGAKETTATIANRIHKLFAEAKDRDPAIFPPETRIRLNDRKIFDIVQVLQDISLLQTDVDSIGIAFENFFGSVFRGELGQYFTMRPLCRFIVAALNTTDDDYILDPTAGSGGFLLEALLQVWHQIDRDYAGQPITALERVKNDFALQKVYGIEIHDTLARICKINLLLHHDGHTNIEGDKSCLDAVFSRPRLNPPQGRFTKIVGNPPFGDEVAEGDEDLLGQNTLDTFEICTDREKVPSEHVVIERCVQLLEDGGRFGLVLPDGVFNNQGEISNCPRTRRYLVKNGFIEAIVSLPDYAFRKSGAQNKTSVLFFRKFREAERQRFNRSLKTALATGVSEDKAISSALRATPHRAFLAEANWIGYTATGTHTEKNELYRGGKGGHLDAEQSGTILGEFRRFQRNPQDYPGRNMPDCMALEMSELWDAHASHRLDPKYHLFKREERDTTPEGWVRSQLSDVMIRRENVVFPETLPDTEVKVMTLSQTGDIRPREAGKGRNPPEWLGMYFEDGPSTWYAARTNDVVFSSIDLWKGCVSVVPEQFDGALVTKEFPIYQVTDDRLDPQFLSCLLRSRYYQRAFRAITTGHSNRRRTQVHDFEALEICFPPDKAAQKNLIQGVIAARLSQQQAVAHMKEEMSKFSDLIDGRGDEELPEVDDGPVDEVDA